MNENSILIVDDDRGISRLISILLQGRGYKTVSAYTGKDALREVKHRPDLILLDRQLPDYDGLDICRMIREDNKLKSIPIIILSARGAIGDKIEGLYIGADDYVTKPFDKEELVARVETVLRRNKFYEEVQEDRGKIMEELKRIVDGKLLTTFFQPIFRLEDFSVLGFEILNRPPADSSLSNPEFFFRAALTFGMYFHVEMLGWKLALSRLKKFDRKEKMFLNCNPYLIENEKFDKSVIEKTGFSPAEIVLEITERNAIQDYGVFFERIEDAKSLGLGTAIDDVGSGFASLDTIAQVKPNFVKIDMTLIRNIDVDKLKQDIVKAIKLFSSESGITTIAEGVETKDELVLVKELGIDAAQGYLLSKPAQDIADKSKVII